MKDNDLGLYLGSERGSSMETVAKFKPDVEVLSDVEMLARRCVGLFVADAQKTIAQKEVFYLAISGGNTPRPFFNLLGQLPEAISLPWDHIHLFWVDERYVPSDSEASNYKLAADTFLKKVTYPNKTYTGSKPSTAISNRRRWLTRRLSALFSTCRKTNCRNST